MTDDDAAPAPAAPPALTAPVGQDRAFDVDVLSDDDFAYAVYQVLLGRQPDRDGFVFTQRRLAKGVSRRQVLQDIRDSEEFRAMARSPLAALHGARIAWIRSLPRADTILDLGGASTDSANGAMIEMRYPYAFERLTIIDLPPEQRHEEFRGERFADEVSTALGPVRYVHASMTDLSSIPDSSIDLVNSSQTLEHIYPAAGEALLAEVRRVLKPTGTLALDTPNRALTAVDMADRPEEFINPDHKVEYTHQQMLELFDRHGLTVIRAQGIAWMPQSAATGVFDPGEISAYAALFDDIERCYLLAYLARPTTGTVTQVRQHVESGIARVRRGRTS